MDLYDICRGAEYFAVETLWRSKFKLKGIGKITLLGLNLQKIFEENEKLVDGSVS